MRQRNTTLVALVALVAVAALAAQAAVGCSQPAKSPPPTTATPAATATTPAATARPEAPKAAEPAELALAGHYAAPHTVMVVCENPDWCESEVVDRLSIADAGEGRLGVSIELVRANAHTCTFEGTLKREPTPELAERWRFVTAEGDDAHPCDLTLAFSDGAVRIASEGCRYHCGARAVLEGDFPYPPNSTTPANKDN